MATLDCRYEGFISQNLLNSCIMLGLGAPCQTEQTWHLPLWNCYVSGGEGRKQCHTQLCELRGMSAVKVKCNGPGKLCKQRCGGGWIKSNLNSRTECQEDLGYL